MVDPDAFDFYDVAGLSVFFGMEDLSGLPELVQIVGWYDVDRNVSELELVAWLHRSYFFDLEAGEFFLYRRDGHNRCILVDNFLDIIH